jgi:hypothetical protein
MSWQQFDPAPHQSHPAPRLDHASFRPTPGSGLSACQGSVFPLTARGLGAKNTYLAISTISRPIGLSSSSKSQRTRRATVAFHSRITASTASAPKLTSETALKPLAVGPLLELDTGPLPGLLEYYPPPELRELLSELIATGLSELQTFKRLISQEVVGSIANATKCYAENARESAEQSNQAREWEPVNSTETWR